MSQPDEMPTTDFFEKFIKEYGQAWVTHINNEGKILGDTVYEK